MENPDEYAEMNDALRELLAKGLISMEWDEDSEDFVFFMDGTQRAKYDTDFTEEDTRRILGEMGDIPDGW